jgi:hypothetical protein
MAQPIFNLTDDGRRQLWMAEQLFPWPQTKLRVPESLARTTTRKWCVPVLLNLAVWMNAAHRTMGGDVGERMEAGG